VVGRRERDPEAVRVPDSHHEWSRVATTFLASALLLRRREVIPAPVRRGSIWADIVERALDLGIVIDGSSRLSVAGIEVIGMGTRGSS